MPGRSSTTVVGGPYSKYVLGVLFVVYVVNFIDRQILAILLQPIKEDLQITDTALGLLTGFTFALFFTIAGLPLARLADVWVRRSLIAISLAIWSVMTAVSGLARGFGDLALARVGVGIGEAGATPASYSLISDYFPPARRATALAFYSAGIYVGVGLGYWLGGWINDAFGWRAAFFAVGLPGLFLALAVRLTVREPPRGMSERQPLTTRRFTTREVRRFFAQLPAGRNISLAAALHAFAGYAQATWMPAFFARIHEMTPGDLGRWMSWIVAGGGTLGVILGGWLADRWGRREPRARVYVAMSSVLLSLPLLAISLSVADARTALLCYLPTVIFSTMWLGPTSAVVQDLVPPAMRATATAAFAFVLNIIGLGFGPLTVGLLNDWIGTPDAIRTSLLVSSLTASLLAVWFFHAAARTLVQDLDTKTRL